MDKKGYPVRGLGVRNSLEDLIGLLDLGATPEIRASPHWRTARIVSTAWRGIAKATRILLLFPEVKPSESTPWP